MARIPLIGGSYSTRSVISGAGGRCVNYYPEKNPEDALVPVTHYQRPGLIPLVSGPAAPVRGLWRASNGNGYCVIGSNVYQISPTWALTLLGQIAPFRTNPCSFTDFGQAVGIGVLVDGSANGWSINLATGAFAQIADPTGIFVGADKVDYLDTFVLFNVPGTNQFGSTLSNVLQFDPLYIAGKTDYPDPLQTLIVNRHEILLFGQLKSEVWYDAGNAQFPFAELPGAYIEHGAVAKYSVASADISVYWLGQDLQGQGYVFRQRGYETTRISNHALEWTLSQVQESGITLSDAIGYTFQKSGHLFYVLQFPSADMTWVFDDSVANPMVAWHQEAWTDSNGQLRRHRGNCCAFLNETNVCGDWENGTIYEMSFSAFTDTVAGVAGPISCVRTFPHLGMFSNRQGFPALPTDGRRVRHDRFQLDMECGTAGESPSFPSQIGLKYSDDRGKTWRGAILQSAGAIGQYDTWPLFQNLGISRDRVYEVSHSIPGPAAINGAWVDGQLAES